ncbi:MAG: zinc-dependent peptidase [Deltaproteobacteria bacterium]|nr:zinc-dependent peptidase [Deltaproteobacteria bacterium]
MFQTPWRRWRRRQLAKKQMPVHWEPLIEERLSFAADMDQEERKVWLEHLKIFAGEKNFEGIRLELTDEMRVVISGCAARLSRHIGFEVYDRLHSILVYPNSIALERTSGEGPLAHEKLVEVLGLHNSNGAVILSWDDVEKGLRFPHDGHDVALHELAHVIDASDGAHDGTPILSRSADYSAWARVFSESFARLQESPRKHPVDDYGATNEAEFFATATEAFFEKPKRMLAKEPELYEQLCSYYGLDPAKNANRPNL